MAMNLSFLTDGWNRLSLRTKLIIVGVLAFFFGSLWGGHRTEIEANGRFSAVGADGRVLLDTRTGEVWVFDGTDGTFKRRGAPAHGWF